MTKPIKTNADAQSGKKSDKRNKSDQPVDVATLEKSTAKSEVSKKPGPVAAGQAGG